MAKHRFTRAPRFDVVRGALGVTVAVAAAFSGPAGAHAVTSPATPVVAAKLSSSQTHPENGKAGAVKVTAAQVLALAKAQVGTSEDASGGGTKFQRWYMDSPRALETVKRDGGSPQAYLNAAWCSMFVSWVGEESGARATVGWDAYTVAHARWFAANKRFGVIAKPGAVVFFSWGGGKDLSDIQHVGFVVKDNHNGTISTIEGNTGNGRVEERVRPKAQVVGYGYPEYAG
ncbi:CHAP domain-containing protein [Nonomuraea rhizosphaerae]|uniref:CHAP domain-containing protein n=1 Tax=Nonomuraea rhizosphaerae TaxID=2665663 RepID=UPI001C601837|nr:CHAP domain-containing protein [Nonomuraea rhizosphaerae]